MKQRCMQKPWKMFSSRPVPNICSNFQHNSILYSHVPIQVKKAMEEERRKWEVEKVETVKVNCDTLEEQNKERLESMRSEMQQEKSKALALQHKVVELNKVR